MAAKKKAPVVEKKEEIVEESGVSQEALLALGAEMNEIMFPDDKIDYESLDEDSLLEQIKGDAVNIDPADPFSDESKGTLAELGMEIAWAAKKTAKGKKPEKAAKPEKAPKVAKEKKEKAPKEKKDPFAEPAMTTAIMMCVVDNPEMSPEEIQKKVEKMTGNTPNKSTIIIQAAGALKVLAYLKQSGKLS